MFISEKSQKYSHTNDWVCPLRKAAEAKGFSDPKGKLAAADRELASASKAAKQPKKGNDGEDADGEN